MQALTAKIHVISASFLSDPAEPRNFSLTDRSSSSFSFSWTQHYHVDHFVVTVDYDDSHRNVTNDIIITPNVTNGNVTTVNCDIRGLLVPGGNYIVIVSAFANTLNSSLHNDSQPTPFLTSKLFVPDITSEQGLVYTCLPCSPLMAARLDLARLLKHVQDTLHCLPYSLWSYCLVSVLVWQSCRPATPVDSERSIQKRVKICRGV